MNRDKRCVNCADEMRQQFRSKISVAIDSVKAESESMRAGEICQLTLPKESESVKGSMILLYENYFGTLANLAKEPNQQVLESRI